MTPFILEYESQMGLQQHFWGRDIIRCRWCRNAITNTLFQGNFNFSGAITTLSIEVSGRDVNLGIGPLFDDVTVNVIYNVVNTIVTETITTVEEFVALGTFDQETIDVATDIFENNNIGQNDLGEVTVKPMNQNHRTRSIL